MHHRLQDLTGKTYNRLTVLRQHFREGDRRTYWWCRCECGKELPVWAGNLKRGHTKSCGCLFYDTMTTHGMTHSPEYTSWQNMITRCTCPTHASYPAYGGRTPPIAVHERWLGPGGFDNFLAEMGPKPTPKHEIDRFPNKEGNYEPGNCRWATRKEQMRNTSANRLVAFRGVTQPVIDWCAALGVKKTTLLARLNRGWSVEEALSRPVGVYQKRPQ